MARLLLVCLSVLVALTAAQAVTAPPTTGTAQASVAPSPAAPLTPEDAASTAPAESTTASPADCEETAQATFETADSNVDGFLDMTEFKVLIEELQLGWDDERTEAMFVELDMSPQDGKVSFEEWITFSCDTTTTTMTPSNTTMQPCATTPMDPCKPTTTTPKGSRWKELFKTLLPLIIAWLKLHPRSTTGPPTTTPEPVTIATSTMGAQTTKIIPVPEDEEGSSSSGDSSSELWWLWALLALVGLCCLLLCLAGALGGCLAAIMGKKKKKSSKRDTARRSESYDEYEIHPIIYDEAMPPVPPLTAAQPMVAPTMVETVQMVPQPTMVETTPMFQQPVMAPMTASSYSTYLGPSVSQYTPAPAPVLGGGLGTSQFGVPITTRY